MRLAALASLLIAGLLAAGLGGGGKASVGLTQPQYLSLGDSLAASMQPDADGHDRPTSDGFSERVWRGRTHSSPKLTLVKLGRGGETAASMIKSPKPGPSQLELAEQRLRAGHVQLVTIDIGANEVERCATGAGFDADCVQRGLDSLRTSLPQILGRLRSAGGPGLKIVGVNYYNSFLGRWVTGTDGRRLAQASVWVEHRINATLKKVYDNDNVAVADVESRFQTRAIHQYVPTRSYGPVPLAVANTCHWTFACSARYDDHTNSLGYRVIALSVLDLLRSA